MNRTWQNIAKERVATPGIGVGIVATGLHRIILKERVDQVMIYAINAKGKKGRVIAQHNHKTT